MLLGALVLGGLGVAWLLLKSRRQGGGGHRQQPRGDTRAGFMRRLRPPGDDCLEEEWGAVFETSLQAALLRFRDATGPTVLFVALEGPANDVATLRLRQWIWPDAAVREYMRSRSNASEEVEGGVRVVPLRLQSGSADAKLLCSIFKRNATRDCPLLLFLWGKPQVRMLLLKSAAPNLQAADAVRVFTDMERKLLADTEELGLDPSSELRRQQAEELLGAYSNMQAKNLIDAGVVNLRDFVAETEEERERREFGGLSPEELAMIASAEEAERLEREDIRKVQEAEYEATVAADTMRQQMQEEAAKQAQRIKEQEEKEAEDAEAAAIWKVFEKQDKLEKIPPEPPEPADPRAPGAPMKLILMMPGSGRRLVRRWAPTETTVGQLFDFVQGSATEEEELDAGATMALVSNFPTKRYTDGTLTLAEAGLETNMVLRVTE